MFKYIIFSSRTITLRLLVWALMIVPVMFCYTVALGIELTGRTGAEFYWWDDNNDSKGGQICIPLDVKASSESYSFRVLTGYAYSYYDGNGTDSIHLGDILDTKVNLTFKHTLPWDLRLLAGLDLNLPTGRTKLSLEDVNLMMDPDLVPITVFGEGFNANPLLILMRTWGRTDVAIGCSYVWRGEYDYADTVTDYDPGDIQRYVLKARFRQFAPVSFYLGGVYTNYGTDKLSNENLYKPGSMWNLETGFIYRNHGWFVDTGLNYYLRSEDRYRVPGSFSLQDEDHVGYGDEIFAHSDIRYRLNDSTALNFALGFLWIGENGYPESSSYYNGERRKLSMSLGADQRLWDNWTLSGRLMGFTMHDGKTSSHPNNERSYRGYGITVNLAARF